MNPLKRSLIEKAGTDNGFEYTLAADVDGVTLASARHTTRASITETASGFGIHFSFGKIIALLPELQRTFPDAILAQDGFFADGEAALSTLLRRAASLSRALPNHAVTSFQHAIAEELSALPPGIMGTEVERMVRQRVGQQAYRQAMLDYWGCACAVTGIALTEALRASHAKPWSDCASDSERLDVFNGFLLTANFDALFDRFLISFENSGEILVSPLISILDRASLGLNTPLRLRWLADGHIPYLEYHREQLQRL